MTISASDTYIVRSAPSSRVTTPASIVAAAPSSAMPAWPATSNNPPKTTALRMPSQRSASTPPITGTQ